MNKIIKEVKIHGLLANFFGPVLKIHIQNINHLVNAIDCIKNGFRKKLKQLVNEGYNYSVVEDNENKQCIHLIPVIAGSGKTGMMIVGIVLVIIAIVLIIFTWGASSGLSYWLLQIGLYFILPTGISLIITAATYPKTPTGADPQQQYQNNAGATSAATDPGRSFIFDSKSNLGVQGASIPIGYGKLKLGSKLLQGSTYSFETNQQFLSQTEIDILNPPFFDFLAN